MALIVWVASSTVGCGKSIQDRIDSATRQVASGDGASAVFDLKAVLQEAPDDANARLLLARALIDSGDLAGAEVEASKARAAGHPEGEVRLVQADIWLHQRRPDKVLQNYSAQAAEGLDPKLVERVVRAQVASGDIAQARERIATVARAGALDSNLALIEARLDAADGKLDVALATTRRILDKAPDHPDGLNLLGDLLQASGAKSEAVLDAYRKAAQSKAGERHARSALVALLLQSGDLAGARQQADELAKSRPGNAQATYLQAIVASAEGNHTRARELTQTLLKVASKDARVLLLAGQTEARLGAMALADSLLSQAVSEDPESLVPRKALAEFLLNRGQAVRALEVLGPALASGKADAQTVVLAAQGQLQRGDFKAADTLFARAAKLDPADPLLRTVRAQVRVERTPDAAALSELAVAAKADVSPRGDMALIAALMAKKDYAGARKAVEGLATKVTDQAVPDLLRGRISLLQGDAATARRDFEAVLAKNPRHLQALLELVRLDERSDGGDRALARLAEHLAQQPDHVAARLEYAQRLQRAGKASEAVAEIEKALTADPTHAPTRLVVIRQFDQMGDVRSALQAAQAAAAVLPDDPDITERLGIQQLRAGETQQAAITITALVGKRPTTASLLLLAQAHEASGRLAAAADAVQKALNQSPDSLAAHRAWVQIEVRRERYEQAITAARKLQTSQPADGLGYQLEGDIRAARGQWKEAAEAYRRATASKRPGSAPGALHHALLKSGQASAAADFERTWLQRNPDDVTYRVVAANLAFARGDLDAAKAGYLTALETRPDSVEALNNLAEVLVRKKDAKAVDYALRAYELAPFRADVIDTLAQSLAVANNFDKAIDLQQRAAQLAPQSPLFSLNLVRLYIQAGQRKKAREALDTLESQPWAGSRKVALEELRRQAGT